MSSWLKNESNSDKDVKPWDLLNPNSKKVSSSKADERYSICLSCPELVRLTKQCKKCGCFMRVKVILEDASCPLDKW